MLLRLRERDSGRDVVPLGQTRPATGRGRMLRDKHRVSPVRRLLTVFRRMGRREALRDQLWRVPTYDVRTAQVSDRPVTHHHVEPRTKSLLSQPVQQGIDVVWRHEMTMSPTFWNSVMSE